MKMTDLTDQMPRLFNQKNGDEQRRRWDEQND